MRKDLLCKTLVLGVILLFIGVGVQPAFAVETESSVDTIEKEDDCGCQIVDESNPDRVILVLNEVKEFINNILLKFGHIPEVKEKCQELLDAINEVELNCDNTRIIIFCLLGLVLAFALLTIQYDEGTLMYNIYSAITLFFWNNYERWIVIYEEVLNCGEFPDYELGKLNEIKEIVSI